jgi:regulator of nucleoside diphosphate kinase
MKPIYVSTEDYTVLNALLASASQKSPQSRGPRLADELRRATVVDQSALPERVIRLGSRVEIEDVESGERDTYTLCLPWHANAEEGKLSVLAPIGTGLLGYGEDDEIEWQTPGGLRRLRVRSVSQPALVPGA